MIYGTTKISVNSYRIVPLQMPMYQILEVLWIRIASIWLSSVMDPDSYWECGSGSRSMVIETKINK
jgi:hypothetical protein